MEVQGRDTHKERLLLEREVSPKSLESHIEKKGTFVELRDMHF